MRTPACTPIRGLFETQTDTEVGPALECSSDLGLQRIGAGPFGELACVLEESVAEKGSVNPFVFVCPDEAQSFTPTVGANSRGGPSRSVQNRLAAIAVADGGVLVLVPAGRLDCD